MLCGLNPKKDTGNTKPYMVSTIGRNTELNENNHFSTTNNPKNLFITKHEVFNLILLNYFFCK